MGVQDAVRKMQVAAPDVAVISSPESAPASDESSRVFRAPRNPAVAQSRGEHIEWAIRAHRPELRSSDWPILPKRGSTHVTRPPQAFAILPAVALRSTISGPKFAAAGLCEPRDYCVSKRVSGEADGRWAWVFVRLVREVQVRIAPPWRWSRRNPAPLCRFCLGFSQTSTWSRTNLKGSGLSSCGPPVPVMMRAVIASTFPKTRSMQAFPGDCPNRSPPPHPPQLADRRFLGSTWEVHTYSRA